MAILGNTLRNDLFFMQSGILAIPVGAEYLLFYDILLYACVCNAIFFNLPLRFLICREHRKYACEKLVDGLFNAGNFL